MPSPRRAQILASVAAGSAPVPLSQSTYLRWGLALLGFAALGATLSTLDSWSTRSSATASPASTLRTEAALVPAAHGAAPAAQHGPLPPSRVLTAIEAIQQGVYTAVPVRQRDCCPVPGTPCGQPAPVEPNGPGRRCIIGSYARDWEYVTARLRDPHGPGFAYARYADGEREALKGISDIGNGEWYLHAGEGAIFRAALHQSLKGHYGEDYFYGFPTMADDGNGALYMLNLTQQVCSRISYANLWANSNWERTDAMLAELTSPTGAYYRKSVLVVNVESVAKLRADKRDGYVVAAVPIQDNGVKRWHDDPDWRAELTANVTRIAAAHDGHFFIVSAGPLGKVLIDIMWGANCRNRYVDFGSAVDPIFRQKVTRGYQRPDHHDRKKVDPNWTVDDEGRMVQVA